MYVAVKGGERAIENAHRLLANARRGDQNVPEVTLDQISEQLGLAVDRVMSEGSLYDRELAALAIKQARGDLIEAIFLLRAFRTTCPRFGASAPFDTASMDVRRRISAIFKDLPGGQVLGPTFDYMHRLLDPAGFRPDPSIRRRDPLRRGRGRILRRGARFRRPARQRRRDRMSDGQPVQRLGDRSAALHAWLRPRVRPERTQGDVHGARRPCLACR